MGMLQPDRLVKHQHHDAGVYTGHFLLPDWLLFSLNLAPVGLIKILRSVMNLRLYSF